MSWAEAEYIIKQTMSKDMYNAGIPRGLVSHSETVDITTDTNCNLKNPRMEISGKSLWNF